MFLSLVIFLSKQSETVYVSIAESIYSVMYTILILWNDAYRRKYKNYSNLARTKQQLNKRTEQNTILYQIINAIVVRSYSAHVCACYIT